MCGSQAPDEFECVLRGRVGGGGTRTDAGRKSRSGVWSPAGAGAEAGRLNQLKQSIW